MSKTKWLEPLNQYQFMPVLEALASTVDAFSSAGEGTVLVVTTGWEKGRQVILTKALLLPSASTDLKPDASWQELLNSDEFTAWKIPTE